MQKILFLDRDGTIIKEPHDYQIDHINKFEFLEGVIFNLKKIVDTLDYKLVMVTNQDGLGTESYPESDFWPYQELVIRTLQSEGIIFDEVHIDRSFPSDNSPYRKPGIAMLKKYLNGKYDLENSYVIGDRWSDMQLANNLKCKSILIAEETIDQRPEGVDVDHQVKSWKTIFDILTMEERKSNATRYTNETKIQASVNLDGSGVTNIYTGLGFFDHMLEQIAKHGSLDLFITVDGDLEVDEHHTIEDTAIVLGELFSSALAKKAGIQRYGFALPMDEVDAQVLIDFGGRPWIVWDVNFSREKIGDVPTEMFFHFFKSFSDNAKCNLNIKASGENEHHIIEAVFKAFAKAIKMAKERNINDLSIPSTKGTL